MINIIRRNSLVRFVAKKVIPEKTRHNYADYLQRKDPIKIYFNNRVASINYENKEVQGLIPVWYWDTKPNFGDLIGPYIVSNVTGKPVMNIKGVPFSGLLTVGSILHTVGRKDMTVWGSGLIEEPTIELLEKIKTNNPKILSVRGHKTAEHLKRVGIEVPNQKFYGDPALILPMFYQPKVNSTKKIGLCPHYVHKQYFLENNLSSDKTSIIDVQMDMETVVDAICSSQVCISTSLHGLIVAQAYNIPWVWLEITDNNLKGDDFKFKDFFSTIDESQVSHIKTTMEEVKTLDFEEIARNAAIPDKLYDETLILEAFEKYIESEDQSYI